MEPVKKTIDGVDFIFRPFGVFDAFRVLTALQKSVVPGLVQLMAGQSEAEGMAKAAERISEQLTPSEFDSICDLLLFKHGNVAFSENGMETQRLTRDNENMAFKSMNGILEAGIAIVSLNYKDFFGTVKGLFGGVGRSQEA